MQRLLAEVDHRAQARLSWLADRPRWAAAFLVVLCLALYLPGIAALPVTDRDEARFAQASKQMLETGDYIDIRFQQEPRYKKPIGIYWLQSLSVATLSPGDLTQIWAYRVPSLLGIIGGVLLTWWAARPIFGRESALLAAVLVASACTLSLEARIAKSDAVLFASIMATQGALARLYLLPQPSPARTAALFWAALGAGILIKGPVAPALVALTILPIVIFDRDRSWLRNLRAVWGVPLMLAITLPWFIAIGITSDWEFYRLAFGEDFLGKIQSAKEKHWAPPGFYLVVFWWCFWPAALIAPGGAALWLWRNRAHRKALFLLSWIVPFWIALEVTPTKLPHYIMPLFPAIAMGMVWVLRETLKGGAAPMRSYKHAAGLWLFVALAQAAFFTFLPIYFKATPSPWLLPLGAAYVFLAVTTVWAVWGGKFHAAFVTAIATAAVIYVGAFRLVLPSVDQIWVSREIAEVVTALRPCAKGPVVTSFREPSAVFLLGTDTILTERHGADQKLLTKGQKGISIHAGPNGVSISVGAGDRNAANIFVDERQERRGFWWRSLSRSIRSGTQGGIWPAIVLQYHAAQYTAALAGPGYACIDGFNINGGKGVRLIVSAVGPSEVLAACPIPERYRCPAGEK